MTSDEELMATYVDGKKSAFDELFERYAPMLLRIMRRQVRNQDDAAELVQQTFLQLHRARHDFDTSRKLRPWLMTIAYNLKREYFRRRKRKPEAPLEFEPEEAPRSDPLDKRERALRVRNALEKLPQGQREVIAMHWFKEMSFAEVAEVMGLSLSAAKVRAHRGYRALRALLEADVTSEASTHKNKVEGPS